MSDQRAIQRIQELAGREAQIYTSWIRAASTCPGSQALFDRIAGAGSAGQLMDYVAELRYALVFRHLGFVVEVEPAGRKGPDLGVARDGLEAIVEVARFRPVNAGPASSGSGLLVEYGNPARDITKSLEKLAGKFRQVDGETSIIGIWNDDDALEELEMEEAAELAADLDDLPASLQFVLYGSAWHRPLEELLCYPLRAVGTQVQRWMGDLRAVRMCEALGALSLGQLPEEPAVDRFAPLHND